MSWKRVKDHYRIEHIVQMRAGTILIGSSYVSDLLSVPLDGEVKWGNLGPSKNDDLARYFAEMTSDRAKLLGLIAKPDTFSKSIPVFTYKGSEIIEKQCEEPGWPNCTHDGELLYENSFSTDKAKVIKWAKQNAQAGIEIVTETIAEKEADLKLRRERLSELRENLAKLNTNYP